MNEINIDEMMKDSKEIIGEEIQFEAVKQDGFTIRYIHNPSEQVQIAALEQNKYAIQFFKKAWRKA